MLGDAKKYRLNGVTLMSLAQYQWRLTRLGFIRDLDSQHKGGPYPESRILRKVIWHERSVTKEEREKNVKF